MPLSRHPIVARRRCDNLISSKFGAKGAAVHSPSAQRPGRISDPLRQEFEALGYALCAAPPAFGLIEVYPHPALIEFLGAPRRLEYKAGKIGAYWSGLSAVERHAKLRTVWARIVEALDRRIAGVAERLPSPPPDMRGWRLKAFEDKLDAVVCAAIAIACLEGKAAAYGDEDAAIWVPVASG
jgi:predicted RNase H-like nuclease